MAIFINYLLVDAVSFVVHFPINVDNRHKHWESEKQQMLLWTQKQRSSLSLPLPFKKSDEKTIGYPEGKRGQKWSKLMHNMIVFLPKPWIGKILKEKKMGGWRGGAARADAKRVHKHLLERGGVHVPLLITFYLRNKKLETVQKSSWKPDFFLFKKKKRKKSKFLVGS